VVRAEDGRGPATVFTQGVFQRLRLASVPQLITWLYAPETGKREVAALASLLPEALSQGDKAAEAIAAKAANDLAEMAETGWEKSGLEKGSLALTGSILLHVPAVRDQLEARLSCSCPRLRITLPMATPAEGAAKIAQKIFAKQ
jgi:N-acetylglucosamine kinase-like BadF-type ATPase